MKTAVTGATGHVGVHLVRTLLARGDRVRTVVRRRTVHGVPWTDGLEGLSVEMAEANLGSVDALTAAFAGCELVFHAAARISITRRDAAEVRAVNVQGTRNVLAACRAAGVRRVVHFSSIEAIEPRPWDRPVDEDRPGVDASRGSPYALSKASGEREALAAGNGLEVVVINPTAIIGPLDFRPSLLGRAVVAMARGRLPMLVEGGFDWVDVRDVAAAAAAAAERAPAGRRYIVGGRWASMGELAALVCAQVGRTPPRLVCPYALARAWAPISSAVNQFLGREPLFTASSLEVLRGNHHVSHERAARELGYCPRDLGETVADTVEWFRQAGYLPRA
jgi:dihydroflavonol-4-reductase